jgi:D-alanyl-lipoteichoic acid acyltransferase DltB (MBOAT superfamily)
MLFNSFEYIFFLPAVAVILYLIPGKYQWFWLLASSIIFYLTLLPEYLILFVVMIVLNYYIAKAIENSDRKRQTSFILGIALNVIVLAFFKYFGLFQTLFIGIKRISSEDHLMKIILPVGLSFFIFTLLSYLIEVKRGSVKAERHIGVFAASLLFFPKIMQGPIEKPGYIFPQFRAAKTFNCKIVVEGLKQLLWGYFKKLVVADRIAIYVNAVYGNFEYHSGASLMLATFLYSIQIYADFSGYTDIALGSAKILGFNLTNNFKRPYFATSVKEFWSRWHISFSIWLRDYLFLPLAVIFAGKLKKIKYLGITAEK